MKINIGVIFGGRSGEYEVSLQSARAIVSQLDHDKYEIWPIAVARDGRWYGPIPEADVPTFDPAHYLGREVMLPAKPGGELLSAESGDLVVRLGCGLFAHSRDDRGGWRDAGPPGTGRTALCGGWSGWFCGGDG